MYSTHLEPEPELEFLDSFGELACMHAYAGVSVCIQCRQAGYAGCFPGDKYAGVRLDECTVRYTVCRYAGRYAYVGSYAGIASRDVYSMF